LVAEDDAGLGDVLARGLREQGYVVDLVADGEAAATDQRRQGRADDHLALGPAARTG
jgi:DNA-binding response OmpR family regulator